MHMNMLITQKQFKIKYKKGQILSRGQFGVVYSVIHNNENASYALKVIKCTNIRESEEALRQIQIQSSLGHPLIVKIFEYYDVSINRINRNYQTEIGFVMERGIYSLQQAIKDPKYTYSLQDIRLFLAQFIALGAYLQQRQIVHRDIKPANIIVFGDRLNCKLGDFGLCCNANLRPKGYSGTFHYSSPQLKSLRDKKDRFVKLISNPYKDDVYSLGMTALDILNNLKRNSSIPQNIQTLVDQMLENDERKRPTFLDLMQNDLVKGQLQNLQNRMSNQNQKINEFQRTIQKQKYKTIMKVQQKSYTQQLEIHTQCKIGQQNNSFAQYNIGEFEARTICRINLQYILCGNYSGELLVLNQITNQVHLLSVKHKKYVVRITTDEQNNIWTIGGDSNIYLFNKEELLRCIQNNAKLIRIQKKGIYSNFIVKQKKIIQVDSKAYRIIQTLEKDNVTFFQCVDQYTFAVGYSDGFVYGKNVGEAFLYQTYSDGITSIKFISNRIFCSGLNGMVKIYDLATKRLQKRFYLFDEPIIDFNFSKQSNTIAIIGWSGHLQTIHLVDEYSFKQQLKVKNIISCAFSSQNNDYYYLTNQGEVYFGEQRIYASCFMEGWNQLKWGEKELLICSESGRLASIKIAII